MRTAGHLGTQILILLLQLLLDSRAVALRGAAWAAAAQAQLCLEDDAVVREDVPEAQEDEERGHHGQMRPKHLAATSVIHF